MIIGFLIGVNYMFISTSNPHVGGPLQCVLQQIPLIFTVIFSALLLYKRYHLWAWLGALLVAIGSALAVFLPYITGQHHAADNVPTASWWTLAYAVGSMTMALVGPAMEVFLRPVGAHESRPPSSEPMLLMFSNMWLVVWLLLFSPFFFLLNQPPFAHVISNMKAAALCVFTGSGGLPSDNCSIAGFVIGGFVVVASLQLHAQAIVSSADSAAWAMVLMALAPFAADGIFAMRPLMGSYYESASLFELVGLAVCLVGTVVFVIFENRLPPAPAATGASATGPPEPSPLCLWFLYHEPKEARPLMRDERDAEEAAAAAAAGPVRRDLMAECT